MISRHLESKVKIRNDPNKQIATTTESSVPWSDFNFTKVCSKILLNSSTLQRLLSAVCTGSRRDVFVVRTSKPVKNIWKNGLFWLRWWLRYSFVTYSVYRKPRDWGLTRSAYFTLLSTSCLGCQQGYGLQWLIFKMANNKVNLGQIRSEEIVYSRFIKIPLG